MKLFAKLALACAVSVSALSTGAASAAEKFIVGYANMADTDVFVMARKNAFIEAAKSDPAVEVNFSDANNDASKQLDQIDNFIAQKVNAIVVVPVDYQGIVPGVEKANAAGIPVIALGIQSAGGKYTFVGSKNIDAGRLQGEFMKANLPKDAKILYLEGTPGLSHTQERKKGFGDALGRTDVKTLASLSANYDRAEGMKVTEDWIQSFSKFDGIIAANDQMALGALEALKGANRVKGVLISGVDGVPDALTAIKAGEMSQTIFQDAAGQAKAAFEVVEGIKKGEQPPAERLVPFASITKENVNQFIKK
ncbi:sugar ABC transporter substrate-binding protein [Neorhizobium galegae]|uniref:sugar ABC transporter substrate-binding protein n=1 Tax=Neorhizobium galegae TaxID=399 RepID=UPI00062160C4|nr:sugar ABC transporter substrate-binding protein [Neorhizobium galegae]MCQ1769085.1 sugar ABC transporter substrate-binding protein [Neorhizobium galegae]MCQ1846250.1 sugar ABC transporter substrate-binding protein [Neorhizobium galegae]CDZ38038.1 Periplasmic binding protein/LacI transcriptional regulator [Neorhizobium galegae bv. officinalis]